MKQVIITLVKSPIGSDKGQKATLKALGLGKIGSSATKNLTPSIEGMIKKVSHLVEVK